MGKLFFLIGGILLSVLFFFGPQTCEKALAVDTGVIINEVLYDPEGTDTGLEWVELFNSGPDINLTGYDLYAAGSYYTFGSFTLSGGGYVLIHINQSGIDTDTDLYQGASSNMGNTSATLALFNSSVHNSTTIIDFVQYGLSGSTWKTAAIAAGIWTDGDFVSDNIDPEEGYSMARLPNGQDTDSSADWANLTNLTPGKANVLAPPPPAVEITAPTDLVSTVTKDTVSFSWVNSNTEPVTFEFLVSQNETMVEPDGETGLAETSYLLEGLSYGIYYWQIIAHYDGENFAESAILSFEIAPPVYSNKILINEIMADPDGDESKYEWIELFNNSDEEADLTDWAISDIKGSVKKYTLGSMVIAPRGFLLFYRSQTGITLNNDSDGARLYQPNGFLLYETPVFTGGGQDLSWARGVSKWAWTEKPTPGKTNVIYIKPEEEEDEPKGGDDEEDIVVLNTIPIEVKTGSFRNYDEKLVKVTGTVITTSGNTFYVDDGSGQAKIYIQEKTGIDKPPMHKGDIFEIIGIVNLYRNTWRILPQKQSDVKLIQAIKETQADIEESSAQTAKSTSKSSTAGKTTSQARAPAEPLVKEVKAAEDINQVVPEETAKSNLWLQIFKALTGLAIIFLLLLIVKIYRRPKIKVIGGHFGEDET